MHFKLEPFLNIAAAAVNVAAACGLDPSVTALLLGATSVGLAISGRDQGVGRPAATTKTPPTADPTKPTE